MELKNALVCDLSPALFITKVFKHGQWPFLVLTNSGPIPHKRSICTCLELKVMANSCQYGIWLICQYYIRTHYNNLISNLATLNLQQEVNDYKDYRSY